MKKVLLILVVMVALVLPIAGESFYLSGFAEAKADPNYPKPVISYDVSATIMDTFRLGVGNVIQTDPIGGTWKIKSFDTNVTTALVSGPIVAGLRFKIPSNSTYKTEAEMFLLFDWSTRK